MTAKTDADRADEILHRILEAIEPDQRQGGFEHILAALQQALVFQMSLACPECRKHIARRLRADIPAMLTRASALAREAQQRYGEQHFLYIEGAMSLQVRRAVVAYKKNQPRRFWTPARPAEGWNS